MTQEVTVATFDHDIKAPHLGGGNCFDDMRIDISESHRRFANLPRNPKSIRRSRYPNSIRFHLATMAMRLGIQEFLVVNGICKRWLSDFRGYWSGILNGRPLWNTLDFFMLLHDYRKRQQLTSQLEWGEPTKHLANWQNPNQIYATLHGARKIAMAPVVCPELWRMIPRASRVLEFGCSLAPYYHCYRNFFSHLDCKWTLVDIPNYPFHYAKYLYGNDAETDIMTIEEKDFSAPLGEARDFDIIILTTVLEHLDNPVFLSEYLLKRLKPGGLFVFDYIKSEATGLDHPNALATRIDCLKNILAKTRIIYGKIDNIDQSVGLSIARKLAP